MLFLEGIGHRFGYNHYNGFENSTDNKPENPFHSLIRCSVGRNDDQRLLEH